MSKKNRRESAWGSAAKKKLEEGMDKVGMTPGSTLLPEGLARELLGGPDLKKLRPLTRKYLRKHKKRTRAEKELEKREKDAAGEPPGQKDKVKKMTRYERAVALRKEFEEMFRDNSGKE